MSGKNAALIALAALCACSEPAGQDGKDAGRDASVRVDGGHRGDAGAASPDGGSIADLDSGSLTGADGGSATLTDFWANTQWPPYLSLKPGEKANVYGQVWVSGGTDQAGAMPGLEGQLGEGPWGSDPSTWTWTDARFNADKGNNDELMAELTAAATGPRAYAFRYRVAGSVWQGKGEWLYAGLSGPTLEPSEAGVLAVRVAGAKVKIATQNLHCQNDDAKARLDAMVARWAALQVDAVALEEVCDDPAKLGNSAAYLADALSKAAGRTYGYTWEQTHLANDVTPEGVGLVSALPAPRQGRQAIDLVTADFPRKALLQVYASPAGMIALVAGHLSYRSEDAAARLQQANQILTAASDWRSGSSHPAVAHALIAGDFNTGPDTPPIQAVVAAGYTDAWAAANPGLAGLTFPSHSPSKRIDYLLLQAAPGQALSPESASLEFTGPYSGSSYVSDHLGVVATFAAP